MTSNYEIIDVCSDSSCEPKGLNNPPPPPRKFKPIPGYRTKEQARKKKHDVNASARLPTHVSLDEDLSHLPRYVYNSDVDDDIGRLENAFQQAFEKAASSFMPISVPVNAQSSRGRTKPPRQILGLPCPRLWNDIKDKGVQKKMHDFTGKGKRSME